MEHSFKEIKKNFGFGCMRLPLIDGKVDDAHFCQMIDTFIENGFNYFDTACMYVDSQSEGAIKRCLTSRYSRDQYILVDKLSSGYFEKEEDIEPFLDLQLEKCGVDYFDFYLMHAQSSRNYNKYQNCNAYSKVLELKEKGKIKHLGISVHDTADVLDMILTDHPEIEIVQIQFNYLDYEDPEVQSRKCYEVCVKHNKPVIVMEPVKGGSLANLPEEGKKVLEDLNNGSVASYAVRFAASFDNIIMVLSGMSNMDQMNDNLSFMKAFVPLNEKEFDACKEVVEIIYKVNAIQCTGCRYCVDVCPKKIVIPEIFNIVNRKRIAKDWHAQTKYNNLTLTSAKASECIRCGKCENICPQKLNIRELLADISKEFDK